MRLSFDAVGAVIRWEGGKVGGGRYEPASPGQEVERCDALMVAGQFRRQELLILLRIIICDY
jgi:hypothetical protein